MTEPLRDSSLLSHDSAMRSCTFHSTEKRYGIRTASRILAVEIPTGFTSAASRRERVTALLVLALVAASPPGLPAAVFVILHRFDKPHSGIPGFGPAWYRSLRATVTRQAASAIAAPHEYNVRLPAAPWQ